MYNREQLAEELIDFLNSLLKIDPDAVTRLIDSRVECNYAMANHPSVQVIATKTVDLQGEHFSYNLGPLGILNGICGTIENGPYIGWGWITAVYDGNRIIRFEKTVVRK